MRVIKIGGRAQADPSLPLRLKEAWLAAHGELCVVHGGGDEVSSLQRAMGRPTEFVGGRRVTSRGDIELLRMVLSGAVNKRLVNSFVAVGIPALGISGEDAHLIEAEQIDAQRLGMAGKVAAINVELLRHLVRSGYLPVISPVAYWSGKGGALNVNGDDAAAAMAIALGAEELLLVADVDGVRGADGGTISTLNIESAVELVAEGIAEGGMAAKLESATIALESGVIRVKVCGLAGITDADSGTFIIQQEGVTT
ncbi:MAG TPA: acetylglutamate kinase [Gemmatimonadaceae bacterium]|nr:acetylglutamate kinase [Gemmatimonadaceae bacterium]